MKQGYTILLLIYFVAGAIMLPLGDFSVLPSLPSMYRHCKTFEHPDMTPVEFITDHLINIDGVFDKHEGDDDQRPHNPEGEGYTIAHIFYLIPMGQNVPRDVELPITVKWKPSVVNYQDGVKPSVFRPPIV